MIPVVKKPHPDELLYSWVHRLADANGLSFSSFCEAYAGIPHELVSERGPDFRINFHVLWENLGVEESMRDLYLSLTTFSFESAGMVPWHQAKYLSRVFRGDDKMSPKSRPLFQKVKLCPACAEEDSQRYGEPYLRRAHQLSGVMTCHRHGCMLHEYSGRAGRECLYRPEDYKEIETGIPPGSLELYTAYAKAMLDMQIDTNAYLVRKRLFDKAHSPKYPIGENYEAFRAVFGLWEHSCLCGTEHMSFLKTTPLACGNQRLDMTTVVTLLMFWYHDASVLPRVLGDREPSAGEYVCMSCGRLFCLSPSALRSGWGCPFCEEDETDQERFEKIIQTSAGNGYKPREEFRGMRKRIAFYHDGCGMTAELRPCDMLNYGTRCPCESGVKARAGGFSRRYPDFDFVDVQYPDETVTLHCRLCGHTFRCSYEDFRNSPYCRICRPPAVSLDTLGGRIAAVTKGGYELEEIVYEAEPRAVIRHNTCGNVQEYGIKEFFDGARCRTCGRVLRIPVSVASPRMRTR